MERFCLDCREYLRGRTDKKFCNDVCRNNYHNRLKLTEPYIKQVHRILKKNRDILKGKIIQEKLKIKRSELLLHGYDFNFHTCTRLLADGTSVYYCYEFGYFFEDREKLILLKPET